MKKARRNKNLSVTLNDGNLFIKSYRGSSRIINYLLDREFGFYGSDPEKIARAVALYQEAGVACGEKEPPIIDAPTKGITNPRSCPKRLAGEKNTALTIENWALVEKFHEAEEGENRQQYEKNQEDDENSEMTGWHTG